MATDPLHQPQPAFRRLYVFGAGGHGREVCWLANQLWNSAVELIFLVDDPAYLTEPVHGIPVRLTREIVATSVDRFVIAVGDSSLRRKAADACEKMGLEPAVLVHPRVEMSQFVSVGPGSVIFAGSILSTEVEVGIHSHVNINCTISHDVKIGDYATLSPGVHVSGHVQIGDGVFIGTGANIVNGRPGAPLVIGPGSTIGAGACVTKSVEAGSLMVGVPAVRRR